MFDQFWVILDQFVLLSPKKIPIHIFWEEVMAVYILGGGKGGGLETESMSEKTVERVAELVRERFLM